MLNNITKYKKVLRKEEKMENSSRLVKYICASGILLSSLTGCNEDSAQTEESGESNGGLYEPGTYTGESEGHGGEMSVEVTVDENEIVSIEVKEHNDSSGISDTPIERIPSEVVETQSLDVDAVSGATASSLAILAAIEDALVQAGGDLALLKNGQESDGDPLEENELHTEVVVIGGGGAGLAAALSAEEHGSEVILLEKMAALGGSTALSGGGISAPESRFQEERGIEDSKEDWMELWEERQATSNPDSEYPDYEFVEAFMDEAVVTTEWLVDYVGHEYERVEGFGQDPEERIHFPETIEDVSGGTMLVQNMEEALEDKNIEVRTETEALELLTDDEGEVIGVVAESQDERLSIFAENVIIAAGGFAQNEELLEQYIPEAAGSSELSMAASGSQGDGILMAEEVGADLHAEPWVMGSGIATKIEGTSSLGMDWTKMYVNENGERFMNEETHYAVATNDILEQEQPWIVLDSSELNADIVAILESELGNEEIAKADDFESLAEEMDIPVEQFVETMETYNNSAETGEDEMGKSPDYLIPVTEAPYYAIKAYPRTMGTFAGLQTNEHYQVLDEEGNVINRLYATGESANKAIYNQVYMSGSAVQFAITSGRLAGEHAAETIEAE